MSGMEVKAVTQGERAFAFNEDPSGLLRSIESTINNGEYVPGLMREQLIRARDIILRFVPPEILKNGYAK